MVHQYVCNYAAVIAGESVVESLHDCFFLCGSISQTQPTTSHTQVSWQVTVFDYPSLLQRADYKDLVILSTVYYKVILVCDIGGHDSEN